MSNQKQTLSSTPPSPLGRAGEGLWGWRRSLRSILHFKMYSGINILGLALSLACVIIIFRYAYGEFRVDHFNPNIDRVYVTMQENANQPGKARMSGVFNPNSEKTFVDIREHPGIERHSIFVLFSGSDDAAITVDDRTYNPSIVAADSNFIKISGYPVIAGIDKLSDPHSALITQSYAQKVFGDQNPLGTTFRHSTGEMLTITGIIGQISTKSTMSFDMVVSHSLSEFWSRMPYTLVLLYPGVDYRQINRQHEPFFEMPLWNQHLRYQLFPLSEVYFDKNSDFSDLKQGNYSSVALLIIVGILILLVGVINFINIYTVVVLRRGREFGIKRVFGAEGRHLFMQLWSENLLMIGVALALALVMVRLASPLITHTLQLDQIPNIHFTLAVSFLLLVALPLVTTLYPYFRYNYSTPVTSLHHIGATKGSGSLRRIFLMFQYIFTMVMIVVSLFFIRQLQFMLHTDPGYRTKDIIKVQFLKRSLDFRVRDQEEREKRWQNEERIVGEIEQKMDACPLFSHWTYGDSPNNSQKSSFSFKTPEGEFQPAKLVGIGEKGLALFDIQLKEGRLWDDQTDNFREYIFIVTESALKLYGITDIRDALLQPERRVWYMSGAEEEMKTNPPYRIVGVVKDFDYMHLSQQSDPIVFYHSKGYRYDHLMACIVPGRTQEAIDFLKKLHDDTVGGEFAYSFVEDEIQEMYREDRKVATVYSIFTFIAIFVSALGLFGMSLFDIQQRRKEIAVRKVNGASVSDIIRTLLKTYFLSLAVSFIIAAPVALLAIHRYLEGFAHKAPVSWWLFAAALAVTAGISLLTLVYQTQKAAGENPAEVVKSE
jgi:ABC-type antimicrobial peptide transport system permease subunit